jgi:Protein of unknown function (DUF2958)
MDLLTDEVKALIPALYSTEKDPDPMVPVKFFNAYGGGTWYVVEGGVSPVTGAYVLYTYVTGLGTDEMGWADPAEMQAIELVPGVTMIERDLYWEPVPLSVVRSREGGA